MPEQTQTWWAATHETNGWIPESEPGTWDDNRERQCQQLGAAEYWRPEERDNKNGYAFKNYETDGANGGMVQG